MEREEKEKWKKERRNDSFPICFLTVDAAIDYRIDWTRAYARDLELNRVCIPRSSQILSPVMISCKERTSLLLQSSTQWTDKTKKDEAKVELSLSQRLSILSTVSFCSDLDPHWIL